jgi:cytoskeletal protein CcmA (bactofilin family)
MFSDKKTNKQIIDGNSSQNIISQDTTIIGDLSSSGDFRIDGVIEGNIKSTGKIVVGSTGFIKGTLQGTDAYFEGKFSGKLTLSGTLTLKPSAHIEGEVVVGKLSVDPDATFNVKCTMKGTIKEMNKGGQEKETGKTA